MSLSYNTNTRVAIIQYEYTCRYHTIRIQVSLSYNTNTRVAIIQYEYTCRYHTIRIQVSLSYNTNTRVAIIQYEYTCRYHTIRVLYIIPNGNKVVPPLYIRYSRLALPYLIREPHLRHRSCAGSWFLLLLLLGSWPVSVFVTTFPWHGRALSLPLSPCFTMCLRFAKYRSPTLFPDSPRMRSYSTVHMIHRVLLA